MSYTNEQVEQSKAARKELIAAANECPVCLTPGLVPLGGLGTCWWECPCGSYSPMCKTWEEALERVADWQMVSGELNACMTPKVGESQ